MTECKAVMEAHFDNHLAEAVEYIQQPHLDPRVAERYAEEWKKDTTISNFLRLANTNLRMVKSGKAAIVTDRIVMSEQLQNVAVLDASFPIRKLVHYDKSIRNAEMLPDCVRWASSSMTSRSMIRSNCTGCVPTVDAPHGQGIQRRPEHRQGSGQGGTDHPTGRSRSLVCVPTPAEGWDQLR